MDEPVSKRKPGRPRRYTSKRPQWQVRLPASIGDEIVATAKAEGRSISEEIERRVIREHEITQLLRLLMSVPSMKKAEPPLPPTLNESEHPKAKADTALGPLNELVIEVSVAAGILGIGRNAAYEAVRRGEIPSVRIGGRIVVPTAPLRKMLGIEPATDTDLTGGSRD